MQHVGNKKMKIKFMLDLWSGRMHVVFQRLPRRTRIGS
jgi:hypothetical protein